MNSNRLFIASGRSNLLWDLLLAVVAVATVTGLRLLLIPVLYDRAAFLLFGLAVMISSWIGGRRVGLITTTLATFTGLVLLVHMFPESNNSLQNETLVALFAVEGCGISLLAGQLHAQRSRAKQEALDATQARNKISELVESIPDGYQAFDADFRLTFMNRATEKVLDRSAELPGRTFWDQFPALDTDVEQLLRRVMLERTSGFCETYYAPFGRWFSFHVNPFGEGVSVLFRDISQRKQDEAERERLIGELRAAVAHIRTLRGLIPICAWCKRIRNDDGYWEQLEAYIKEPFGSRLYSWDVSGLCKRTNRSLSSLSILHPVRALSAPRTEQRGRHRAYLFAPDETYEAFHRTGSRDHFSEMLARVWHECRLQFVNERLA